MKTKIEQIWRFRLSQLNHIIWDGCHARNENDDTIIISYEDLCSIPPEEFAKIKNKYNKSIFDKKIKNANEFLNRNLTSKEQIMQDDFKIIIDFPDDFDPKNLPEDFITDLTNNINERREKLEQKFQFKPWKWSDFKTPEIDLIKGKRLKKDKTKMKTKTQLKEDAKKILPYVQAMAEGKVVKLFTGMETDDDDENEIEVENWDKINTCIFSSSERYKIIEPRPPQENR